MNKNLYLVFSIFLLVGIAVPAYAQISDNVVINEVDINPPGDDSASVSEWVELYNPTDSNIDLGNWEIASTTVLKKSMTISSGTIIKPGQFLTYPYQPAWFTDVSESVELRDENGIVIDKTPMITDLQNNFSSWQRIYDGYDLDSSNDWKFVTSTAGSSNGKLMEIQETDEIIVTISSDKSSYLFGDIAIIKGSVSEEVLITTASFFKQEPIIVNFSGPNFYNTVSLFPDLNLNYKTTLNLQQVFGISEGTYDVSVTYAGITANTSFTVGSELIEQVATEDGSFSIATDASQYIPGQTVSLTGLATEIIPFEGMTFSVKDSQDKVIYDGHLFPIKGEFATTLFLTTVDPDYGTYEITAEYFDKSASTTFEVVEDFKESTPISLWTDKDVYALGDEVKITGRLNQVHIDQLNLEIINTNQVSDHNDTYLSQVGRFKISSVLPIMGDGSFSYTFTLPTDQSKLGDYRINVSKDIGSITKIIHVVANPDEYVASDEALTIFPDKEIYELGDKMILSGVVRDLFGNNSTYEIGTFVDISISHEDGTPLEIIAIPKEVKLRETGGVVVAFDFTALPQASGSYSTSIDITALIFTEGVYNVKAEYLDKIATNTFTVVNPLDLKDGAIISLDKEVYGPGETIYLTGVLPPTPLQSVNIFLTRSDGTTISAHALNDNQKFSWSWTAPLTEKFTVTDAGRHTSLSNFGLYKITVDTGKTSTDLFFKLSLDPENDSLPKSPIFVSTDKSLYKAGEKLKVSGNVINREQGDEGIVVQERVLVEVHKGTFPFEKIHGFESLIYTNTGGAFSTMFELPVTIFTPGSYTVKAFYAGLKTESTFSIVSDFVFADDAPLSLLASTDKSEYFPGDVVIINAMPNRPIYLEDIDLRIIQKTAAEIRGGACDSIVCGAYAGPLITIRPSSSVSFTHEFLIPDSMDAIGLYEITIDTNFETKKIQFNVIEKSQPLKLSTIIEKENRIPEKSISIVTEEKIVDDETISPRVVSGSLVTPLRSDISNVNLKVSTVSGTCIVGSDADCLVKESTRKQGQIYDVVEVDGINLNVRYSGPDVRLEKFSILPESSTVFLPDTNWNVEVIKDDQVSRFYYKITYKTLE